MKTKETENIKNVVSPLMSKRDASAFLGLKISYLSNLVSQRKIPFYRSPTGRVFFLEKELYDWATSYKFDKVDVSDL